MKEGVSVLIIAQDAALYLKRCLDSLKDFPEVILVDGGSRDNTAEIAQQYPNVRFYKNPWPGFIEQRNFSREKATYQWCFMIDADEALTPETAREILKIPQLKNPKVLYNIMRTEFYLGQAIEQGYGKSAYQERLFQTTRVSYGGTSHHSHFIDGKTTAEQKDLVGYFAPKLRILHDESYGLHAWVKKLPRFTLLIAQEKIDRGRRVYFLEVLFSFFYTFLQIFCKTVRQGKIGGVVALQTALYRTLVKLVIYERSAIGFEKRQREDESLG